MEGGMSCIKYLMFFFNLLIFLGGAALFVVGIWVAVSSETFKQVVSSNSLIFSAVYIIIAVGAALFLIGFLGCCGAVNENRCLLGTFFSLILVLFLVQIVGIILVFVFAPEAEKAAKASINSTATDTEMKNAWNSFQLSFMCCGIEGSTDWAPNPIPYSCHKDGDKRKPIYKKGCKETVTAMFWVVGGIGIAVLVIELLAMIFSCCLYRSIGEYKGFA